MTQFLLICLCIWLISTMLGAAIQRFYSGSWKITWHLVRNALFGLIISDAVAVLLGNTSAVGLQATWQTPQVKYLFTSVAICSSLLLTWFFRDTERTASTTKKTIWWTIAFVIICFIASFLYWVPLFFHDFFGEVTAEQLIFLLTSSSGDTTDTADRMVWNTLIIPCIACAALAPLLVASRKTKAIAVTKNHTLLQFTPKTIRIVTGVILVISMAISSQQALKKLPLADLYTGLTQDSSFVADHYVEPTWANLEFPQQQRNLIHIYMESMETSFLGTGNGSGMTPENLIPELQALMNEPGNVYFSNSSGNGGIYQNTAANHSVAGMINMNAGIPMKTNRIGVEGMMYPNFGWTSDILAAKGYNITLMMNADAAWGDVGPQYRAHGANNILDHQAFIEQKLIPADYRVEWGVEDEKLYAFAQTEMTRLAAADKPFYLVMENADTHTPGYVNEKCTNTPFDSKYSNAVFCSQHDLVQFVRWIQAQPWYENTTIVLTGDHLTMEHDWVQTWNKGNDKDRTIANLIINGVPAATQERMHNRVAASFDMFPTILTSIGIKIANDKLGLGTNLYSDKKTLFEELGREHVDSELRNKSDFFIQHKFSGIKDQ